ncbi:ABC transporter ATP-binding protein [Paludibacterium paludis]|uniref:ABC transporter ATP-binding protein n=1 Tax=Paludibacterium paludis TaxID=1225769 RepID=A0A918U8T4_9NEIS|nr:ABC transporter ATP-binding protein [Paludibacterium paludis]GGY10788.1 ABC transporter ATP-binding protein [Paludibacterium paludis]
MLELDGVSVRLGDRSILDDLDLVLARGERLAILGPSGCGKSTLLKVIAGLVPPECGDVRYDGLSLCHTATEDRHFALMFQEFALFPHLNVLDNVAFGLCARGVRRRTARRTAQSMLESLGLAHHAGSRVWSLSGGEQQRVALGRSLVTRPRVMLLDEPFSSLDAHLRKALQEECIARLSAENTATILVTHDRHEAFSMAHRVAVMHQGRFVQVGAPEALMAAPATPWLARFLGFENVDEDRAIPDEAFLLGDAYPRATIRSVTWGVGQVLLEVQSESAGFYRVRISARELGVLGIRPDQGGQIGLAIDFSKVIHFC